MEFLTLSWSIHCTVTVAKVTKLFKTFSMGCDSKLHHTKTYTGIRLCSMETCTPPRISCMFSIVVCGSLCMELFRQISVCHYLIQFILIVYQLEVIHFPLFHWSRQLTDIDSLFIANGMFLWNYILYPILSLPCVPSFCQAYIITFVSSIVLVLNYGQKHTI